MRIPVVLMFVAKPAAAQLPPGAPLDVVAEGLANPWGLGFGPDGRAFVSERNGRIRVIRNGSLQPEPWVELPMTPGGPGLLGLALAPDFAERPAVYVVAGFPDRERRCRRPTKALADAMAAGRLGFLGIDGELLLEGGVPILINNEVAGAIGVSGLTGERDAVIASAGAGVVR